MCAQNGGIVVLGYQEGIWLMIEARSARLINSFGSQEKYKVSKLPINYLLYTMQSFLYQNIYVFVCTKWRCIAIFVIIFGYQKAIWLKFETRLINCLIIKT